LRYHHRYQRPYDKLRLVGKDCVEYSREMVQMFNRDVVAAAFTMDIGAMASSP
jgi:hypothetical protein